MEEDELIKRRRKNKRKKNKRPLMTHHAIKINPKIYTGANPFPHST